jgi:hypothetical protein
MGKYRSDAKRTVKTANTKQSMIEELQEHIDKINSDIDNSIKKN